MSRGSLVQLRHHPWHSPGVVIREAYGTILTHETHLDGKVKYSEETKVVDVLVGMRAVSYAHLTLPTILLV